MTCSKIFLTLIMSTTLASQARAADILVGEIETPAPPPALYTGEWNGFYFGAYGGYSWVTAGVSGSGNVDADGIAGGIYTGYNHQYDNNFLLGVEGTAGLGDIEGSTGGTSVDQQWDASLRGRMGYAFERSLLYGFAGYSLTSIEAGSALGSDTNTLGGWNVGAGFETFLTDSLTTRFEYGFADYSSENFNLGGVGTTKVDLQGQRISVGLGLKF